MRGTTNESASRFARKDVGVDQIERLRKEPIDVGDAFLRTIVCVSNLPSAAGHSRLLIALRQRGGVTTGTWPRACW
jgi:hypothetical protein